MMKKPRFYGYPVKIGECSMKNIGFLSKMVILRVGRGRTDRPTHRSIYGLGGWEVAVWWFGEVVWAGWFGRGGLGGVVWALWCERGREGNRHLNGLGGY